MIFVAISSALALASLIAEPTQPIDPRSATIPEAHTQPGAAVNTDGGYVLGVADKIKIVVFETPSLSGDFQVGANGDIAFPLIGPIKAMGLTPQELETSIGTQLKNGYVNDPRVNVEVMSFRPYYILGEVGRPGEYPYSSGLTVLNAVATAGGFTYRANTKRVFVKRVNELAEHPEQLSPQTKLGPGDTLRVGERFF